MSSFKGSQGEWRYSSELGEVKSDKSGLIADLVVNGLEDENGRLIAAAPELLALVMQANGINGCHTVSWQEKARSAIAKVLGQ